MGDRRAELEADVAVMRRLGVMRWGDIELGPLPLDPPAQSAPARELTDAERLHLKIVELRARSAALYAASGATISDHELERLARHELSLTS